MCFLNKYKNELIEGWISIILNFLLVGLKLVIFIFTNSIAILADLIHSLTDMITSVIVIIGAKISIMEADEKHPFGHGRADSIAAVVISILIILTGIEFIYKSIYRILHHTAVNINIFGVYLLIISIIIKIINLIAAYVINRRTKSDLIKADLIHHLGDFLSSIIVLTGFILALNSVPYIDNIAGILIAGFIIFSGINIFKDASQKILGAPPSEKLTKFIKKTVLSTDRRIQNIHDLIINNYGNYYIISLHIELPATLKFIDAHNIADKVEQKLSDNLNSEIIVHIDPIITDNKTYNKIKKTLDTILQETPEILSYHDLRIIGGKNKKSVLLDVVFNKNLSKKKVKSIEHHISTILKNKCKFDFNFQIKAEPLYSY